MKKIALVFILLIVCVASVLKWRSRYIVSPIEKARKEVTKLNADQDLREGDLIFQTSLSKQSMAVQLATKSRYSHCGIILKNGSGYNVFEAVQPVKFTPLYQWIARGQKGKFVIKRLKNSSTILTPTALAKMHKVADQFKGKSYDLFFEWSGDKIYCSELIWKIYQRSTGIEIGKLQKLSDLDLKNAIVKKKMEERYGNNIPFNETVISPEEMFDSELLITVKSN
ncbi:YiiX family permuted papain-like enzyme [Mucilaginibacter sp. AW1-3]